MNKKLLAAMALTLGSSSAAMAANCPNITFTQLQTALQQVVALDNGGFGFNMWATIVGVDGTVCLVAKSGTAINSQWLNSRNISAQKASTANGFSITGANGFALSSANLYSATQPNGSLYGLQAADPVDPSVAYSGASANFGTALDPMIGRKIGGINVFGGGLALYDSAHNLAGGLGVSGDSSCADHNIGWRVREKLTGYEVVNVPAAVGSSTIVNAATPYKDNIQNLTQADTTYPFAITENPNGWKHPFCTADAKTIAQGFNAGNP